MLRTKAIPSITQLGSLRITRYLHSLATTATDKSQHRPLSNLQSQHLHRHSHHVAKHNPYPITSHTHIQVYLTNLSNEFHPTCISKTTLLPTDTSFCSSRLLFPLSFLMNHSSDTMPSLLRTSSQLSFQSDAHQQPSTQPPPKPPSPSPSPSLTSNIKGRGAMLRTWVMTNPFVSSVFEEDDKTLAKQTRLNTLHNRNLSSPNLKSLDRQQPLPQQHTPQSSMNKSSSDPALQNRAPSLSSSESSRSASPTRVDHQAISFANNVVAYYDHQSHSNLQNTKHRTKHVSVSTPKENLPHVLEPLKASSNKLPLEVRHARARGKLITDPSQPLNTLPVWGFRKTTE